MYHNNQSIHVSGSPTFLGKNIHMYTGRSKDHEVDSSQECDLIACGNHTVFRLDAKFDKLRQAHGQAERQAGSTLSK